MDRLFVLVLLSGFLFVSVGVADEPAIISIVDRPVSGHVHPSICLTPRGTLVVVIQGRNVLMCSRSADGGNSWSVPAEIPASAKRPDSIRPVKRFEVYPGTVDVLPDGRALTTWNYIADDRATDKYYERALLYVTSSDDGETWSDQHLIGPVDGRHLGAVRHNVQPWSGGRWLLPLRDGGPRLFDEKSGDVVEFPLVGADGIQQEFQQIVRTAKGSLLAMGPVLLHSTNEGKSWTTVEGFPASAEKRDNLEGRYLTTLKDGRVLVTWGVGHKNKGLRFNLSSDDGRTWDAGRSVTLFPELSIAARYYSARTIQLDDRTVGTVFMNRDGVHFVRVTLEQLDG